MVSKKFLSHHFALSEFLQSDTAKRYGITLNPSPEIVSNLTNLCKKVLEPIRFEIKSPLLINSGYRNKALNHFVKGAPNSYHLYGRAADIVAVRFSIPQLAKVIEGLIDFGYIKPTEFIVHKTYIHIAL